MTVPAVPNGPHSRLPKRDLPATTAWSSMSIEELEQLDREVTHRIEDIDVQLGSRKADTLARRLPPNEWQEYVEWRRRAVGAKMHLVGYKRELRVVAKNRRRALNLESIRTIDHAFQPGDTVGALRAAVAMLTSLLRDGVEFDESELAMLNAIEGEMREAMDAGRLLP